MKAQLSNDVGTFAEKAIPFFMQQEVASTVPLSVLLALAAGRKYGDGTPELWTVEDGGAAVLFALRTPPFSLTMARGSVEAAAALGRARAHAEAAGTVETLPGVTAPKALAKAFAEAFAAEAGCAPRLATEMRLYDLERVQHPKTLPGGAGRLAVSSDLDTAVELYSAFVDELDVPSGGVRSTVERGIADERFYLWTIDGRDVSMALRGGDTPNSTRIALVFTRPEARGKGYAGACVAMATQAVLDSGKRWACLNADLANPTSNALYVRLGFRPVCDIDEWKLSR